MKKTKAVVLLMRLPFLTVTLGGVALGTGFARWETGAWDPLIAALAFLGAAFIHAATNVVNDYYDYKAGTDAANRSGTSPFSGGSGMVLGGHVKPGLALAVSIILAGAGSGIGLYLTLAKGAAALPLIGLVGLLLVFSYNGWPLRLVNKGLGELAIFLGWGPIVVLGSYYVQTRAFVSAGVLGPCYLSGVMTTLVLLINEFADRDADAGSGRKTFVTLYGYSGGLAIYLALALSCYAVVVAGVAAMHWPPYALLALATLPLPFQAFRLGRASLGEWGRFLGAVKATILMNFLFLCILAISFMV
jgi:1,4-dihydroxy-2-naphthoate octaprenyltransferase